MRNWNRQTDGQRQGQTPLSESCSGVARHLWRHWMSLYHDQHDQLMEVEMNGCARYAVWSQWRLQEARILAKLDFYFGRPTSWKLLINTRLDLSQLAASCMFLSVCVSTHLDSGSGLLPGRTPRTKDFSALFASCETVDGLSVCGHYLVTDLQHAGQLEWPLRGCGYSSSSSNSSAVWLNWRN